MIGKYTWYDLLIPRTKIIGENSFRDSQMSTNKSYLREALTTSVLSLNGLVKTWGNNKENGKGKKIGKTGMINISICIDQVPGGKTRQVRYTLARSCTIKSNFLHFTLVYSTQSHIGYPKGLFIATICFKLLKSTFLISRKFNLNYKSLFQQSASSYNIAQSGNL